MNSTRLMTWSRTAALAMFAIIKAKLLIAPAQKL